MIDPLDAELHRTRGNIYMDLERLDEALVSYQQAQKLAPENPNNCIPALARILEKKTTTWLQLCNGGDGPRRLIRRIMNWQPMIANILYKLELPEEGDHWYARVTALAPGSPVAQHVGIHRYIARKEYSKAP